MASRSKKNKMRDMQNEAALRAKPLTIMDVNEAYVKGFQKGYEAGQEEGFKKASLVTIHRMYGAILLAGHELYGFGQERGIRMLNRIHYLLLDMLNDEEVAQRVLDEIGVEIDWEQPIELAQPKEPVRKGKHIQEDAV